jgi:hypothetical protein
MLGMLEHCVTGLGVTWAFCDADSMAIVGTEQGGLALSPMGPLLKGGRAAVRPLSPVEGESILVRFAALNPYDVQSIPGSVLEIEKLEKILRTDLSRTESRDDPRVLAGLDGFRGVERKRVAGLEFGKQRSPSRDQPQSNAEQPAPRV